MVASISSGTLSVRVNVQMYDTGLTDAITSNVLNEVQTIVVTSNIVYESYVSDEKEKKQDLLADKMSVIAPISFFSRPYPDMLRLDLGFDKKF